MDVCTHNLGRITMKFGVLFGSTAAAALMLTGSALASDTFTIGITQNNVGVDSYQTTYERAFMEA